MSGADQLDRVIAESWPPAVVEERDGWLFRHTAGVTRRADVEAAITAAERFVAAVVADNEPSLRLFDQLGFRRSHRYAYFA